MRPRGLVTFVALLLCSAVVPAAPQSTGATTLATPVVEIPIDLSTRHVSVEVSINGEGPFHFNLDTYAVTAACVDQRFAKRMGFKKVVPTNNLVRRLDSDTRATPTILRHRLPFN